MLIGRTGQEKAVRAFFCISNVTTSSGGVLPHVVANSLEKTLASRLGCLGQLNADQIFRAEVVSAQENEESEHLFSASLFPFIRCYPKASPLGCSPEVADTTPGLESKHRR